MGTVKVTDLQGQTIRGYQFIEEIGAGGYGVVYKAHQPEVARDVAIKIIAPQHASKPEFAQRFKTEARLVAQLEHPHIVPLYDYWQDKQGAFLVMRYVRGGNLRRRLLKQGAMSLEQSAQLITQIADALHTAHEAQVVHRDLKPDNILLDERDNAYLTDFGIAKTDTQGDITGTDAIVGTMKYLSPEQVQSRAVSPQTDVYALGIMLYEILTAEHPFTDAAPNMFPIKHLQDPVPDIRDKRSDLPNAVDDIIQKATAKDPVERYASTKALATDLQSLLTPTPSIAIEKPKKRPQVSVPTTAEGRNRQRMLQKVRSFWVDGVLKNSLHGAALLELGMRYKSDAVEQAWSLILQQEGQQQTLPAGTDILDVYDDLNGEMLILGEPGSGKTTTLLQLTDALITRAEMDANLPMPVVFNLSSWADNHKPIAQWLADELNTRYQIPTKLARDWVESDQILPLLDGLDEVKQEQRDNCVKAINAYREEHGLLPLVVCSRIADYDALQHRLRLQGAILLQPLTQAQVNSYLNQFDDDLDAVRAVLAQDEKLQRLVTTPLLLNIVLLAYRGMAIDEIPSFDTLEGRRRHLFDTYIERMLERRSPSDTYSIADTKHYLSWLGEQMSDHAQSVFLIERMQPDWLDDEDVGAYRRMTTLAVGATAGAMSTGVLFVLGFILTLFSGGFGSLGASGLLILLAGIIGFIGIPFGLGAAGLFWWRKRQQRDIQTVDLLQWSWSALRKRIPAALTVGGATTILFMFVALLFGSTVEEGLMVAGVMLGIPFFSLDLIQHALQVGDVPETTQPNEGVRRSFKNWGRFATSVALGAGIPMGVIFSVLVLITNITTMGTATALGMSPLALMLMLLMSVLVYSFGAAMIIGLPFGILFGMLFRGGSTVVEHIILRRILRNKGDIPDDYADFLDYAAEHILMRKVGGGYIYMHRMLLEHFAQREKTKRKHDDLDNIEYRLGTGDTADDYEAITDDSDEMQLQQM